MESYRCHERFAVRPCLVAPGHPRLCNTLRHDALRRAGRQDAAVPSAAALKTPKQKEKSMLSWALTFLVIAIVAAVLGFGGIAGTAAGIAKILFVIFLVLFVVSFIIGRRAP
ncbi:hypothetical protein D9M68_477860 [compost metagenome]